MDANIYRRVYVEVITTEQLETRESVSNMMFQLSEGLRKHSAVVQLHVVERAETLARIASGADLIPHDRRLENPSTGLPDRLSHAECLYRVCLDMGMPKDARERR